MKVFIVLIIFSIKSYAETIETIIETTPDCSKAILQSIVDNNFISNDATIIINDKTPKRFCFDIKNSNASKDLIEDFKLLDAFGVFDNSGCLLDEKKNAANEELVAKFIKKNLESEVNVFAKINPSTNEAALIYTNSRDMNYVNKNALTKTDKWQIAAFSAGTIAIGALVSEKIYEGQGDKRMHWKVGAVVSGVTTGATYFLVEEMGLGEKFGLSAKQKKGLIMFSGPIMGTIAGILKEVYDRKYPKKHTTDPNDAIATSLGAGGAIFAITLAL